MNLSPFIVHNKLTDSLIGTTIELAKGTLHEKSFISGFASSAATSKSMRFSSPEFLSFLFLKEMGIF
jgi:hypothetical protein